MSDRSNTLILIILAVLSLLVLLVWSGMNYLFFTHGIPQSVDPTIFSRILGTMDGAVFLILNYWFGGHKDLASAATMLYRSIPKDSSNSGANGATQ